MKPWVVYTAVRLLIFTVALILLLIVGVPGWLAAIVAAVIGLCTAYIFFRPQRDKLTESIRESRNVRTVDGVDEEAEDSST